MPRLPSLRTPMTLAWLLLLAVSPAPPVQALDLDGSGIAPATGILTIPFGRPVTLQDNEYVRTTVDGTVVHELTGGAQFTTYQAALPAWARGKIAKTAVSAANAGLPFTTFQVNTAYDAIASLAPGAITASRRLYQTKIDLTDPLNNFPNYFENDAYLDTITLEADRSRLQAGDAVSHRIVDFDGIVVTGLHAPWQQTDYALNKAGGYGTRRIPLLLIHGWQGDSADKECRQQSALLLWKHSELVYWQHFLDYYLVSSDLHDRYHVYLYHYPTYKHITFNAKILKEMLDSLRSGNSDISGGVFSGTLVIMGHSMGGLVGRALVEEHAFTGFRKLIALDSPHHGSQLSDNPLATFAIKDIDTQGAADLNWDNADMADTAAEINNNNVTRRWAGINAKAFDDIYLAKMEDMFGQQNMAAHASKNPWLRWLNESFAQKHSAYSGKYIFYAAALSTKPVAGIAANDITDATYNGIFDVPNAALVQETYTNGGTEPTGSGIMCALDAAAYAHPSLAAYFSPPSNVAYAALQPVVASLNPQAKIFYDRHGMAEVNISTGTEHPYAIPYRLFFDYDHEMIINGAYGCTKGCWDKYLSEPDLLASPPGFRTSQFVESDSGFWADSTTDPAANHYSRRIRNMYQHARRTTLAPSLRYNPLRYEPLFLCLERDLLDAAASGALPGNSLLLLN